LGQLKKELTQILKFTHSLASKDEHGIDELKKQLETQISKLEQVKFLIFYSLFSFDIPVHVFHTTMLVGRLIGITILSKHTARLEKL
jgi:hypothetical protein